ncbi:hypothetical protein E4U40_001561 [Claviceps sp. LM458 group G5]|nr:hypothetical protein E4U40_001561 [Claviceps sp. LM458 group G5]KAG6040005.1 hypothetical protein E4U39_007436 [Claviceps sp. Clav50 group G5]
MAEDNYTTLEATTTVDDSTVRGTVQYPSGFCGDNIVSHGLCGLILLDEATQTIVKTPLWEWSPPSIQREIEVYQRLVSKGPHPGILTYHGEFEQGFRLEYAPNADLYHFLQGKRFDGGKDHHNEPFKPTPQIRLQWMLQAAEALDHIHKAGIVHGDLTTINMFLDKDLNLKIGDFAGSSIDSNEFLCAVTESHLHPTDPNSEQGDIFAYGSAMYEIFTSERPYAALSDEEIAEKFQSNLFPDTSHLGPVGRIIRNCWQGGYANVEAIVQDIKRLHQRGVAAATSTTQQPWICSMVATAAQQQPRLSQVMLCTLSAVALAFLVYQRRSARP